MGAPTVRDAAGEDAEAYARVRYAAWQVAYKDIFPAEMLAAIDVDEWIAGAWEAFTSPPDPGFHRLVSVDASNEVVAMAFCGPAREPVGDTTAELYAIYATPEVWGRGHGSALIQEVHRRLADDGHSAALLWVAAGNDPTIAWYARHGWRPDGTTKTDTFYGAEVDELRLVRTLTG